ncbi:unnamed protein product [Danaus chrysippus]|uniref:(African queen) hypothetical protein n=1 Tax=Danaus chrysippus TaxID=151541 RepID=A0A8J2VPJ5_9NEOP|nr:unnamed protein product [Danaus chrysippus]
MDYYDSIVQTGEEVCSGGKGHMVRPVCGVISLSSVSVGGEALHTSVVCRGDGHYCVLSDVTLTHHLQSSVSDDTNLNHMLVTNV